MSAPVRPLILLLAWWPAILTLGDEPLPRLAYNHPGLVVDLGVGLWAWPLPMDYDGDGDLDLVVVCPDVPYKGTYFFENPAGDKPFPIFKPAVRIDRAVGNPQVSYVDGRPRVLAPGVEFPDFRRQRFASPRKLNVQPRLPGGRIRANQWKYADLDGDGLLDLVVGQGDWADYGWDNAFDTEGRWTRGPLHGYVYWLRNEGSAKQPRYSTLQRLAAGGKPLDVYGMPSPNLADFDGDGDLDLLCGEFLDGFSYCQNEGSSRRPQFAAPRRLQFQGQPLRMDLQMIVPVAVDWDRDGDVDLVVGDEDGRVALVEHTGRTDDGLPCMRPPRYFQQQAADVKFGALVTPVSHDWDADGDEDLVCGNTAGYIGWIENLDGGNPPRWAKPRYLRAGEEVIRIQAGPQGSIQGPCEAKWGYTTLSVADWDHDGLADLVVNSIWGKVIWFRNAGQHGKPRLEPARPIEVQWPGKPPKPAWTWWEPVDGELATQWRTTPLVVDFDEDGLNDLLMLDQEGYLALFRRLRKDATGRVLLPPQRMFVGQAGSVFDSRHQVVQQQEGLLRLNNGLAGRSGRRKFCLADWDGDGRQDLLVNSRSVDWLRNVGVDAEGRVIFDNQGPLSDHRLAGHTTSPTTVDWDRNGIPDLLVGAEDGFLYYLPNPRQNGGPNKPPGGQ